MTIIETSEIQRMGYKLFLDDLRTVQMVYPNQQDGDFVIVRTYQLFVNLVNRKDCSNLSASTTTWAKMNKAT